MTADDTTVPAAPNGEAAQSLALGALDWLLGSARTTEEGLAWPAVGPGAAAIAAAADREENCSLYFGLAGMAVALNAVHVHLNDSPAAAAARRALDRVRTGFDGQRCGPMFELLGGNAGGPMVSLSPTPTRSTGPT